MTKKKEDADREKEFEAMKGMPLQELILDHAKEKYLIVPLAAEWAKELKRTEEFRHMTQNEILDKSLYDVITGAITWDKVKKIIAANGHGPAVEGAEAPKKKKDD